jgi:hypothetical protein
VPVDNIIVIVLVTLQNVQTQRSITYVPVQFGTMPNAEGRKVALITGSHCLQVNEAL